MASAVGTAADQVSKGYRRYVFTLLFLLYLFDYVDRLVVTSLFPFIKADWGISDAQCGMLVSAVYWSIVVFTFPVSILVDRWSRKKTIALMGIVWSVATALCALAGRFGHLFACRTLIGIGEAGYAPGGTAMIAGLYPPEQRSRIMGIWNASIPLGSALGIAIGGLVAAHWGWRHAFGLVALPGLVIALLFFWVKDYKTVELARTVAGEGGPRQVRMRGRDLVREFSRNPTLLLTYLGFAGVVFCTTSLLTWLPTFFHRVYGIPEAQAGVRAGAVMLLALFGAPLGGYLADVWMKRRINARLLFAALSTLVSSLLLFIALTFFQGTLQYVVILVMGLTVVAFLPAAAAVTQDVVHPGLRAVSYALCVICQNLLGASLGPVVIGALSDHFGIEQALTILPAFLVLAALLFFAAAGFYRRDLAKVEKVALEIEG